MPKYFFHTQDGTAFRDSSGMEMADALAAEREAVIALAELVKDHPAEVQEGRPVRVVVTDETGKVVFSVGATAERP